VAVPLGRGDAVAAGSDAAVDCELPPITCGPAPTGAGEIVGIAADDGGGGGADCTDIATFGAVKCGGVALGTSVAVEGGGCPGVGESTVLRGGAAMTMGRRGDCKANGGGAEDCDTIGRDIGLLAGNIVVLWVEGAVGIGIEEEEEGGVGFGSVDVDDVAW